jgi:predicted cation transporter
MMEQCTGDLVVYAGLGAIFLFVLVAPFVSRGVEKNLEPFLFIMGLAAVLLTGDLTLDLLRTALVEPLPISLAVLITGFLFYLGKDWLTKATSCVSRQIPPAVLHFLIVVILGLSASIITAIIASLVLVEVILLLNLDRKNRVVLSVLACFAISLGAVLTPLGEPLSAIASARLKVDFFYLMRLLGLYLIPGIFFIAFLAALCVGATRKQGAAFQRAGMDIKEVIPRAFRVYIFIMALIFLGEGFRPLIDRYVVPQDSRILYWINMISAVLDNATLAAAELTPSMNRQQVSGCLMGLLLSGGMLIPGNIPNIITASRLQIASSEWARVGIPLGLGLMIFYYVILF